MLFRSRTSLVMLSSSACLFILVYGAFVRLRRSKNVPESFSSSLRILLSQKELTSTLMKDLRTMEAKALETNSSTDLPNVLVYQNNEWRNEALCKPYKEYQKMADFQLHDFKTNAGTVKIFTNDERDFISAEIMKKGAFEVETVNRVIYELKKDKTLNLIDIGTNLGQYSVAAALIGRESLAIDGAQVTMEHLCATVQYLNITDKITMIYNIMSDSPGKRQVRYSASNKDFGGTFVEAVDLHGVKLSQIPEKYWDKATVEQDAVALDNLLNLPKISRFQRVFIKMDVEGHEHKVLQGGIDFFDKVHVAGIVMEWFWHKRRESGQFIKSFMEKRGFKPYEISLNKPQTLSDRNHDKWPQDVLWLPETVKIRITNI